MCPNYRVFRKILKENSLMYSNFWKITNTTNNLGSWLRSPNPCNQPSGWTRVLLSWYDWVVGGVIMWQNIRLSFRFFAEWHLNLLPRIAHNRGDCHLSQACSKLLSPIYPSFYFDECDSVLPGQGLMSLCGVWGCRTLKRKGGGSSQKAARSVAVHRRLRSADNWILNSNYHSTPL
jgi:hypothetical protein